MTSSTNTPQIDPPETHEIPCPVKGDVIIFTNDIDDYVQRSGLTVFSHADEKTTPYAILQFDEDVFYFVVLGGNKQECALKLTTAQPGFDSTAVWQASDTQGNPYLIFIHYPVSGRSPIPEECRPYFVMSDIQGSLSATIIVAYISSRCTH